MVGVFKEPLLHFLLAGAVLFGAYAGLKSGANTPETSKQPEIHLTAEHVNGSRRAGPISGGGPQRARSCVD